jgi:hydrophobic/amphiphilic exporter-1 (mainly G- bacteria), HAE1 family
MKSIVRWSIANSPALNIAFLALLLVGGLAFGAMRRESFPEFDLDMILIAVPYPGAAPQEVEEGICQKIEEAVRTVEGVKKVTSIATEGSASVVLELLSSVDDPARVLDDVRSEVDRIPSFPVEAEDPEVQLVVSRRSAIRIGVLGPDERGAIANRQLREIGEKIRDDLLLLPEVSQVEFLGAPHYQIDVEVSEETLRSHGLTLRQAAAIIRRENRELPAGSIRGESQEVLLRGNNRRISGEAIGQLPLVTQEDGAVLTVADLGTVRDDFEDTSSISEINGQPALALSVQRSSSEDLLAMVDSVKKYVADAKLPTGYRLITWSDESVEVRSRLELLIRNGWQGLCIVFILLVMFLDLRLAFWVALGIPFAMFATGGYLYLTDQTLNMISMFAFVMALGIIVDDAIVVGENIYSHRQMGKDYYEAAVDGAAEVMPSVSTSVSTTIVAFAPLLFVSGIMGKFMAIMPAAIIAMLAASLIECTTVLPAHLAHRDSMIFKFLHVVFYAFRWMVPLAHELNRVSTNLLNRFVERVYEPTLRLALKNRMIVVAGCLASLTLAMGLVRSGVVPRNLFPKLDGNAIVASLTFPDGTPDSQTDRWTQHIEDSFWKIADQFETDGKPVARTSYRVVGTQVARGGPGAQATSGSGSHIGSVEIELVSSEERDATSETIIAAWRQAIGTIPGTEQFTVGSMAHGPGGAPVEFKLLAPALYSDDLEEAVEQCKTHLTSFPGVKDIVDDSVPGKWEYRFRIKPDAASMGVSTADLAETVRAAYFGEEVMRLQRGRHEVKLMVRYPREERNTLASFDDIRVRSDDGAERPITELAEIDVERGYSEINRVNQLRSITVTADMDEAIGNAELVRTKLKDEFLPALLKEFPHVQVRWEGQAAQSAESMRSLFSGFVVAVLVMFVLLTLEFKSYLQPCLVLLIIPFGLVGAIVGHALLGLPLTMFSMFGIVALTGIVVNDSIVLIDFINSRVKSGLPLNDALAEAGTRRFRPVLLTTVTTIGGLLPILLETSFQAQILIPMATSIAFGEMFATALVLYLVPVSYSLYASLLGLLARLSGAAAEKPTHATVAGSAG